ncbi:unnamed protein product [Larinioides sclopetarius]|uniref:Uncharacterized protein n=1 Tax=Larinioides sclopetarius TaxID=280406 RepID=A0AAV1ZIV7_9ARAC
MYVFVSSSSEIAVAPNFLRSISCMPVQDDRSGKVVIIEDTPLNDDELSLN